MECSTKEESGSCSQGRTYYADEITSLLLSGLASRLGSPQAVRVYLEEYRAQRQRLAEKESLAREKLARQLASTERSLDRLVKALEDGVAVASVKELENDRERITRELESLPAKVNVVELHPTAINRYLEHLNKLAAGIENGEIGQEDRNLLRELVDRVILHRAEPGHLDIEVMGKLSALMEDVDIPPTARLRRGDLDGAG